MNRKHLPINPENNAAMGIEKLLELRSLITQAFQTISENKEKLEICKPEILEKLDTILLTKEKLMTYFQKVELDSDLKRQRPLEDKPWEFEKRVFYQKLLLILRKLEYEILIIKLKKLGNNLKGFCLVWDTLLCVYIYIEKSKSRSLNDRVRFYRIFDIVITNLKDKGSKKRKKHGISIINDLKEAKELRERELLDTVVKGKNDAKIQNLKRLFELHFCDLVFEPDSVFFQRVTLFIRKVFFHQKPQTVIEFEYLVCWYLNGYRALLANEEVKCGLCGNRMIFDSAKTGFLPCTVFKNNVFFHDKCFVQK